MYTNWKVSASDTPKLKVAIENFILSEANKEYKYKQNIDKYIPDKTPKKIRRKIIGMMDALMFIVRYEVLNRNEFKITAETSAPIPQQLSKFIQFTVHDRLVNHLQKHYGDKVKVKRLAWR